MYLIILLNNSFEFSISYLSYLANKNFRIIDTQGRTIVNDKLQISEGLNTYRLDYDLNIGFYFLEVDNKKIKIIVQ